MTKLPFLLNEARLSEWCYLYCRLKKDDFQIRKYITFSFWAYMYCRNINNDPEIRKNITSSKLLKELEK